MTRSDAGAVLAVPGDLDTPTGGYVYDRKILHGLKSAGRRVSHLALPGGFPFPTAAQKSAAMYRLGAVDPEAVLVIDGLAYGALDPSDVARIAAPVVALVHHPLALETGLGTDEAAGLRRNEIANLAHARAVIVTSHHTAAVLVQDYGVPGDRITVAPPGVEHPATPTEPEDPPLILTVGSLSVRKGHDVLLDALAEISDLDWRSVIVGKSMDEDVAGALNEQVALLGLDERVRFEGAATPEEVSALFARATVFALATRYEGYGMVFAEALAHGLPIVTCRAGAVPDTVPSAAGFLLPPDDARAFADALRAVLTNPARRETLAKAAWNAGRALPDWADTAAIIGRVIDQV